VFDKSRSHIGESLAQALEPRHKKIGACSDRGGLLRAMRLGEVWADAFPMALAPVDANGLGVLLLFSNAKTHLSFTNTLAGC
jgi:hypothetical protein